MFDGVLCMATSARVMTGSPIRFLIFSNLSSNLFRCHGKNKSEDVINRPCSGQEAQK
jgi:hypothetical protein